MNTHLPGSRRSLIRSICKPIAYISKVKEKSMDKLDDIEKDKIVDKILLQLENKEIMILNEQVKKTTIIESK